MCGYYIRGVIRQIHKGAAMDTTSFEQLLSSKSRLDTLSQKSIGFGSVWELTRGLFSLNKQKMMLSLLFFILRLCSTVSMPFFLNYTISKLTETDQAPSLAWIMLLILCYKLVGSLISISCDFLYSSLGIEYFSYLYAFLLSKPPLSDSDDGKMINILEYDCNMVSSIVYSTFTSFFYSLEIMILFGLLVRLFANTEPYSVFGVIACLYIVCQGLASFGIFVLNRNYVNQKDKRIASNLGQSRETMLKQRQRQITANGRFLFMRMVGKFITYVFPLLLNIYAYLIAGRAQIAEDEYTILIVINLIRSPIGQLMLAMNLNAEILNSCKRIVEVVRGDRKREPRDDISQELVVNTLGGNSVCEGELEVGEVGTINLGNIAASLIKSVDLKFRLGLPFLLCLLMFSRYYANFVTKMMLVQDFSACLYLGLSAQIVCPILFYSLLITSIQKMAGEILNRLPSEINYEVLNRISGDIAAVDRSATINTFEISFSFTAILGSYIYSISSIGLGWAQAVMAIFLGGCLCLVWILNRFVMKARRELFRGELTLKSGIVAGFLSRKTLSQSQKLSSHWKSIFERKQMGILSENYYMTLVSLTTLTLSLLFIFFSLWLIQDKITKSILLMICLTLDRDMILLFFAMVRLELSLVSFQRVINVIPFS